MLIDNSYTNPFLDKFISQLCYNYMTMHTACIVQSDEILHWWQYYNDSNTFFFKKMF